MPTKQEKQQALKRFRATEARLNLDLDDPFRQLAVRNAMRAEDMEKSRQANRKKFVSGDTPKEFQGASRGKFQRLSSQDQRKAFGFGLQLSGLDQVRQDSGGFRRESRNRLPGRSNSGTGLSPEEFDRFVWLTTQEKRQQVQKETAARFAREDRQKATRARRKETTQKKGQAKFERQTRERAGATATQAIGGKAGGDKASRSRSLLRELLNSVDEEDKRKGSRSLLARNLS